jgi:hypothetical protein
VTAAELTAWRDAFLAAGEAALKARPADGRDVEIGRLTARVGELTMANEVLDATIDRLETNGPLARRRSRRRAVGSRPPRTAARASPWSAGSGGPPAPPPTVIETRRQHRAALVRLGRCPMTS